MKIKLINMPFAYINIPSIALTQLKSVTETALGDKVEIDIHYLNHDIAEYLTVENYTFMSVSGPSNNSGFGDWFFRQVAFPDLPDNTEEYISRYGHLLGGQFLEEQGAFIQNKRAGLDNFFETLIEKYELDDCDVIGFTSLFMQNVANLAMIRKIKEKNPNVVAVMGGANCETPMGEELVKNFEILDYVFSGTSLISFPKLVEAIMNGQKSNAEAINGVFSRTNVEKIKNIKAQTLVKDNGEVETLGPIGDEMNINECVPLNYDSFLASFNSFFSQNDKLYPRLLFETSRGCWWGAKAHCTFCGLNGGGMAYRAMKDEHAIEMINDLIERYGDQVKHFSCVDNIIPKEYVKSVFPYVKNNKGVVIFYEVRADLSLEDLEILSNAGVREVQPGIESLSTSTLKLMKKGTNAFNNIRFLQDTVVHSVIPQWNLLIGFPGEEESVYEKYCRDMPFLYHLPPPGGVFPVRFDRYSPYFTRADEYELDLKPLEYFYYTYPIGDDSLMNMVYYFGDQNFGAEYIRITGKWLKKLEHEFFLWEERWSGFDENNFPSLYLEYLDGQIRVVDDRLAERKIIPLTATDKEVLINLNKRKNLAGLSSQMPDHSSGELSEIVNMLFDHKLLFEEKGSYMNIVFDQKPILKL